MRFILFCRWELVVGIQIGQNVTLDELLPWVETLAKRQVKTLAAAAAAAVAAPKQVVDPPPQQPATAPMQQPPAAAAAVADALSPQVSLYRIAPVRQPPQTPTKAVCGSLAGHPDCGLCRVCCNTQEINMGSSDSKEAIPVVIGEGLGAHPVVSSRPTGSSLKAVRARRWPSCRRCCGGKLPTTQHERSRDPPRVLDNSRVVWVDCCCWGGVGGVPRHPTLPSALRSS